MEVSTSMNVDQVVVDVVDHSDQKRQACPKHISFKLRINFNNQVHEVCLPCRYAFGTNANPRYVRTMCPPEFSLLDLRLGHVVILVPFDRWRRGNLY
jgi:hypothetical protein